jgi:hypothetical protein
MSNDSTTLRHGFSESVLTDLLPRRSNMLAIAEGVVLLGGLTILNATGLLPFSVWNVHPFLFVVILLSAQYGIEGGISAAVGAIILSLVGGWPVRPIDMSYVDYFRVTWADPLSWIVAALVAGIVTTHRGRVLQQQTAQLQKAVAAEQLIATQYQVLAQRTHMLERRLALRAEAQLDGTVEAEGKPAAVNATVSRSAARGGGRSAKSLT